LSQTELDALIAQSTAKEIDDNDLATTLLIGWDEVTDAAGEPIEFSPALRDKLLDIYPVRPSVISAWFESISGGAKRKN